MKIIKDIILKSTRWLNLVERTYEDKNGKEQKWIMSQRNNDNSAVLIVPYYDAPEGTRLIITREYRVPLGDYEWGFPAGLIEEGETILKTVIREMREETGLQVDEILNTSPKVYNSSGMTDETISIVYIKCSGTISKSNQESNEDIDIFSATPADVKMLMENPHIKFGAKSWLIFKQFVDSATEIQ